MAKAALDGAVCQGQVTPGGKGNAGVAAGLGWRVLARGDAEAEVVGAGRGRGGGEEGGP